MTFSFFHKGRFNRVFATGYLWMLNEVFASNGVTVMIQHYRSHEDLLRHRRFPGNEDDEAVPNEKVTEFHGVV